MSTSNRPLAICTRVSLWRAFLVLAVCIFRPCLSDPIYKEPKRSFIKAYVISTDVRLSTAVSNTIFNMGMIPILAPAVLPYAELYSNKTQFVASVFGFDLSPVSGLTFAEISLIASHKSVMDKIAQDYDISEDDWSLVLEDDARLVPSVKNASSTIADAIMPTWTASNTVLCSSADVAVNVLAMWRCIQVTCWDKNAMAFVLMPTC